MLIKSLQESHFYTWRGEKKNLWKRKPPASP